MEVVEGRETLLGPNHLDTLSAKYNYANTLINLKRCKEAEKLYLEVIKGCEALLGPNH